ncbi:MAG TPA: hypothetical protein PK335_14625, partial [Draconibacterium sp.]|nr:hypothetical protein [Draconibacterium sp.]
ETVKYEKNNLRFSFELPVNFQNYGIRDKIHNTPEKIQTWLFTPSANFKYELKGFWTLRAGAKYNQQMSDVSSLAQGYVFSSYRQLKKGINELAEKKGFRYNIGLEYKNPISGFFSTFSWINSHSKNNLLLKQQINNEGLLFYDVIRKDNRSYLDNLSLTVNQYLANWQATVNFKAFYNRNKKEYLLNTQMGWLTSKVYAFHPGISINRWRKVDFEYNYEVQLIKQKSEQTETSVIGQEHKSSIFYKPEKRHLLGLSCEFYNTKQSGQKSLNTFFTNFSYHFKPSKGKLKYKFEVRNIFNQSEIISFYNSDISLVRNSYTIRPRQFLITVSLGL